MKRNKRASNKGTKGQGRKICTLKVTGIPWDIYLTPEIEDPLNVGQNPHLGFCDYMRYEIHINEKQSPTCRRITLGHELMHAACGMIMQVDNRHEEHYCDVVGHMYFEIFDQLIKLPAKVKKELGINA